MDEATKNALNEFVIHALGALRTGAQWSTEQAPLLVQEWLRWYLAESLINLTGGLVLLAIAGWITKCFFIRDRDMDGPWPIVSMLMVGPGIVFVVIGLNRLVKVCVAPRVVVFEALTQWLQAVAP